MPLSFRGEASFKVTAHTIFIFDIVIDDSENLNSKVSSLFAEIETEVQHLPK